MVAGLVDSAILVDVLRGYAPAGQWLQSQPDLGITIVNWMELVNGARNKSEHLSAQKLLSQFTLVYLIRVDQRWAAKQLSTYKLSHNVGILDCLIASVSFRMQLPIFTRNLKHFAPLLGGLAQVPYT